MRIWKYPLEVTDRQRIDTPPGAKLLTVQIQGDKPCLWALVDERFPGDQRDTRYIAIYGTGNPLPELPGNYIATFQMMHGAAVFHAFEI